MSKKSGFASAQTKKKQKTIKDIDFTPIQDKLGEYIMRNSQMDLIVSYADESKALGGDKSSIIKSLWHRLTIPKVKKQMLIFQHLHTGSSLHLFSNGCGFMVRMDFGASEVPILACQLDDKNENNYTKNFRWLSELSASERMGLFAVWKKEKPEGFEYKSM